MKARDSIRKSKTDWNELNAMTDQNIDYSDIAPLDAVFFKTGKLRVPESKALTSLEAEERDKLMTLNLQSKINHSKKIIREALRLFSPNALYMAWTGHKDSTTMLWLFRETCGEVKSALPRAMLIDDGFLFEEALELVDLVSRNWGVDVTRTKNDDLIRKAQESKGPIRCDDLTEENQREIKRAGFTDDTFVLEPESFVCSHLLKTVPMNKFIETHKARAIATAIRWDEHDARSREDFFSTRSNPEHVRLHPMLHFTERDIWDIVEEYRIPTCSLYAEGYRSLGAKGSTGRSSNIPSWGQDIVDTQERSDRDPEKEEIMARLRAIGYI